MKPFRFPREEKPVIQEMVIKMAFLERVADEIIDINLDKFAGIKFEDMQAVLLAAELTGIFEEETETNSTPTLDESVAKRVKLAEQVAAIYQRECRELRQKLEHANGIIKTLETYTEVLKVQLKEKRFNEILNSQKED